MAFSGTREAVLVVNSGMAEANERSMQWTRREKKVSWLWGPRWKHQAHDVGFKAWDMGAQGLDPRRCPGLRKKTCSRQCVR